MKIILIGPQGSGKSTQADLLAKKFNLPILSTGNLCRQITLQDSTLAKKVRNLMTRGILVDDETIFAMVDKFLEEEGKGGFLAEGFPRSLNQAERFDQDIDYVFHIKLSQEEAIRRLTARWLCSQCKENYNLLTKPPKINGVCDLCGGKLAQREDDKEAAVKQRLKLYFAQTEPVLEYYRKNVRVHEIDGSQSIPAIYQAILKIIQSSDNSF